MSGYALANTNEPADELHQLVPTAIERGDVPGDAVAPAAVSTDEQAAAEPAEEGRLNLWAKARGGVAGGTAALGPARPSDDHPGTYRTRGLRTETWSTSTNTSTRPGAPWE
jgi:hypothetical protein